jgi:hypothetical protein
MWRKYGSYPDVSTPTEFVESIKSRKSSRRFNILLSVDFFSSSSAGLDICRPPAVLTALLVLGEVLQNWALRAVVALAIVGKFSERIAH